MLYNEQFNNLSEDEKDAILEFIFSITEGDVWTIGRGNEYVPFGYS